MPLTFLQLQAKVKHTLGGEPDAIWTDAATVKKQIVNMAGSFIVNAHPWSWRSRPEAILASRANDTITGATWAESGTTLTKTGAFANYTFRPGDWIRITGGTGATAGRYTIASKTNNNAIVLDVSIGSGADGQTNIAATLEYPYLSLPSDFGELLDLIPGDRLTRHFIETDVDEIRRKRASQIAASSFVYHYAVNFPASTVATANMPVPRVELYPSPAMTQPDFAIATYRAGWRVLNGDTDKPNVPPEHEWDALLLEAIDEFSRWHEDEDYDAYRRLLASPLLAEMKKRDGRYQASMGSVTGGILQGRSRSKGRPWDSYTNPDGSVD